MLSVSCHRSLLMSLCSWGLAQPSACWQWLKPHRETCQETCHGTRRELDHGGSPHEMIPGKKSGRNSSEYFWSGGQMRFEVRKLAENLSSSGDRTGSAQEVKVDGAGICGGWRICGNYRRKLLKHPTSSSIHMLLPGFTCSPVKIHLVLSH